MYVPTDGTLFPQSKGSLLRGREQENIEEKRQKCRLADI